jgi:hypothetical protein
VARINDPNEPATFEKETSEIPGAVAEGGVWSETLRQRLQELTDEIAAGAPRAFLDVDG